MHANVQTHSTCSKHTLSSRTCEHARSLRNSNLGWRLAHVRARDGRHAHVLGLECQRAAGYRNHDRPAHPSSSETESRYSFLLVLRGFILQNLGIPQPIYSSTKGVMATLQERRLGYHSREGLEPGTSRFSTLRLNHYATRGHSWNRWNCVKKPGMNS
jgi:hypothetical protein